MHLLFELRYVLLKNTFLIKLRLAAKEKINEIERLKEAVRNNEDKLLTVETKISKLLTDLK